MQKRRQKLKEIIKRFITDYLMLKCLSVGTRDSVSPSTANFDAQYTSKNGAPITPKTLLLLIMCPLSLAFMLGRIAFINRRVPKKLISNVSLANSMGTQSRIVRSDTPALLTANIAK